MIHHASVTFENRECLVFELEDYQVEDFLYSIVHKCPYKDVKTGVISWLPPEKIHHLIIKPTLESLTCQNQNLDPASDLLI